MDQAAKIRYRRERLSVPLKKQGRLLLAVLTTALTLSTASHADEPTAEEKKLASLLPAHLFSRDAEPTTSILIDKQRKNAYLVHMENDVPHVVREITHLQFGQQDGDKQSEGDLKTPEGVYRIEKFIPDSQLAPVYGSGAFPLDYPNPLDRIEGRNGSGIWLHGRDDNDPSKVATRGCVAFQNKEIRELEPVLKPGTNIIISPKTEFMTPAAYEARKTSLFKQLDAFFKDWNNADITSLAKILHPTFHDANGLNRDAWVARKKTLAAAYPERDIKISNIYAFKEDGKQVVFDFNQTYCAANLFSYDHKRLFFKPDGDKLSLVAEDSIALPIQPILTAEATRFVDKWIDTWSKNEIFEYLALYNPQFTYDGGKKLADWQVYKSGIFAQRPEQKISYSNLQIAPVKGDLYRVTFKQNYQSDSYTDVGIKTLMLSGCPGDFSIVSESWTALK
ncbi:hypothetical protein C4K68_00890 [Pokkaliibacter plantistimulans]|uniref:L,D-TPase catalytic domain-containing protein n=1 Tax=Proteobacteria bacterium 228 TaxID=2083153 RepID=A0A2S5KX43_9PROT|nr:L,D-transpeptidase family protein [Pokkaliibacter plantistimulans]PPC79293.1 hypothetical protein C4K68_00890 [Pokkaliibacter plantistimulans]